MKARSALILFASAAISARGVAQAADRHDPWMREVAAALTDARALIPDAATTGGTLRYGMLAEEEIAPLSVMLQAGETYVVVATCDRDCVRLSLRVTDGRRYELDSDHSDTRQPVLRITPAVSGAHKVEIVMAGCRIGPCRYGVLVVPVRSATAKAK